MAGTRTAIPYIVTLAVTAAVFLFFFGAFLLFWQYALDLREENSRAGLGFSVTRRQFDELRLVFWLLYGGMISTALVSGAVAGWLSRLRPATIVLTVVPSVVLFAWISLGVIEFQNACNVGESFLVRSHC
jgi:hypothetical protein